MQKNLFSSFFPFFFLGETDFFVRDRLARQSHETRSRRSRQLDLRPRTRKTNLCIFRGPPQPLFDSVRHRRGHLVVGHGEDVDPHAVVLCVEVDQVGSGGGVALGELAGAVAPAERGKRQNKIKENSTLFYAVCPDVILRENGAF